jgi:hypothetical protein
VRSGASAVLDIDATHRSRVDAPGCTPPILCRSGDVVMLRRAAPRRAAPSRGPRPLASGDQDANDETRHSGNPDGLPRLIANVAISGAYRVPSLTLDPLRAVDDRALGRVESLGDFRAQARDLWIGDMRHLPEEVLDVRHQVMDLLGAAIATMQRCAPRVGCGGLSIAGHDLILVDWKCVHFGAL